MAKAIKHTVLVVLGLLVSFTACQTDEWTAFQEKEAPEGYVNIHFETEIPAMPVVTTRSVDPDGKGVNSMQLFCFDSYGLFITTTPATITSHGGRVWRIYSNHTCQYTPYSFYCQSEYD